MLCSPPSGRNFFKKFSRVQINRLYNINKELLGLHQLTKKSIFGISRPTHGPSFAIAGTPRTNFWDHIEVFWTIFDGSIWTMEHIRPFLTSESSFGDVPTVFDHFGPYWTNSFRSIVELTMFRSNWTVMNHGPFRTMFLWTII